MSLLKHVAEHHCADPSERQENNTEDEEILNIEAFIKEGDYGKEKDSEKDSSFVFKEATLDEFL